MRHAAVSPPKARHGPRTRALRVLGAIGSALVLSACVSTAPSSTPPAISPAGQTSNAPTASRSQMPTRTPSAAPTAVATPEPANEWGPLAVARDDARDDLDAGLGPGVLAIGSSCVTYRIDESGRDVSLVWRSGQTRWDETRRQIVFVDRDRGPIRLSHGDRVRFSGAPLMDPASPDQGAPQPTWMADLGPTCPSVRWMVHQVDPED